MPPYLEVPQTPSAKTAFQDVELVSVSGESSPRASESTTTVASASDDGISKHERKAPSPHRSQHLEPPDVFRRVSIGSLSDAHGLLSPIPIRTSSSRSPGPHRSDLLHNPSHNSPSSTLHRPRHRLLQPLFGFWERHRPVVFVFLAQLFGALMNLFARLLELEGEQGMHPFQMLFIRMTVTAVICSLYMHFSGVPHFPLGPPAVRWLLVVRGLTGFFGIFGMWYSMMYLPLAEATVFTFLAPSVSGYICHVLLHEVFTRKEQIASLFALVGVVLIARPASLFPALKPGAKVAAEALANATAAAAASSTAAGGEGGIAATAAAVAATAAAVAATAAAVAATAAAVAATAAAVAATAAAVAVDIVSAAAANTTSGASHHPRLGDAVAPEQRLVAIGVALLGVVGSAFAFTSIRAIGTRAHPLISVNYFSTWCALVSATVLIAAPLLDIGQPDLQFGVPHTLRQWAMLGFICVCGFGTQYFVTKGLMLERSNRATAMMYTNMLFAAGFDRFVFGHRMGPVSLAGCGLIIGSALWAVLSRKETVHSVAPPGVTADVEAAWVDSREAEHGTESLPMLAAVDGDDDEESVDSRDNHPPGRLL